MVWLGRAKGFTLIEVLVATGILSMGVIGAAALQAKALRYAQAASEQSLAAQLSSDLVGRMRANSKNAATLALYKHESLGEAIEVQRNCAALPCTGEQLAAYDLSQWLTQVNDTWASVGTSLVASAGSDPGFLLSLYWGGEHKNSGDCDPNKQRLAGSGCWQTRVVF